MKKSNTCVIFILLIMLFLKVDAPIHTEPELVTAVLPEEQPILETVIHEDYKIAYDPQVVITMNSDFVDQGWPGAGTPENPYRIENLTIDDSGYCIYIIDTDVYFRIRNCTFSGTSWGTDGIFMDNVTHGLIEFCYMTSIERGINCNEVADISINNCTITACDNTALFLRGENCSIANNTITQTYGYNAIYLNRAHNISVLTNFLYDNNGGLLIYESTICNVTGNEFINDGLSIYSYYSSLIYWQHYIADNTVNGRDLGYFWNATNTVITGNYGAMILANCTNVTVLDQSYQDTDVGILLAHCSACDIVNASISNIVVGIYNLFSSNTTLLSLVINANQYDLYMMNSPYFTLSNSNFEGSGYGISSENCEWSEIRNNSIIGPGEAMNLYHCEHLVIDNNTLFGTGITLYDCSYSEVYNNTFMTDISYGLRIQTCLDMYIIDNELYHCGLYFEGSLSYWEHTISNNIVNGKPLLYYWDVENLTIDSEVCGQIIFANSRNISISNLLLDNTLVGIQAAYSSNCSLNEIQISDCHRGIEVVECIDVVISQVDIMGCIRGLHIAYVDNSSFSYCTVNDNSEGFYFYGCYNATLFNCSTAYSDNDAIEIRSSVLVWIENYISTDNHYGVYTYTCNNCTIVDSEFTNNYRGCYLRGDYLTFINNTLTMNDHGVSISSADYSIIHNNSIIENDDEGLELSYSENCTISNNTIHGNWFGSDLYSVYLTDLFNNSFNYNDYGIVLDESHNITIIDNHVFLNSECGISISSDSSNNTVYANQIGATEGTIALDDGTTNYWDNGIDTGNAWSDYSGTPPYSIPGSAGSLDHYPILFEDTTAPYINHPVDMEYELGTSPPSNIRWYPKDFSPESYEIFLDDVLIDNGDWNGGSFYIWPGELSYGIHNFTLRVTDSNGLASADTVMVNVWVTSGALVVSSNADFVTQGFLGSGTVSEPYTISGLTLSLNGTCVYVFDTTAYFAISDSTISSNGTVDGYGILLSGVTHGTISSCSITGKEIGIIATRSDQCTILHNDIFENSINGIVLGSATSNNIIIDNTVYENGVGASYMGASSIPGGIVVTSSAEIIGNYIYDNGFLGVTVDSYSSCLVMDNTLSGNGFYINGEHEFSGNTVNGKAFGYISETSNIIIDASQYGQLYVTACSDVTIINADIHDASIGLWMQDCYGCKISNSSFSSNSFLGVLMYYSDYCTIENSAVYNNDRVGVYVVNSDYINLTRNVVASNAYITDMMSLSAGIYVSSSDHSSIVDNLLLNNTLAGIYVQSSFEGTITGNQFGSTVGTGLILYYGTGWTVFNNKFGWNIEYNARDYNTANTWDNSIDQGNYWDDYSGTGTYLIPTALLVEDRYPTLLTDSGDPTISTISDFSYELEYNPLILEWDAPDENPAAYMLYSNGTLVDFGIWDSALLQIEMPLRGPGVYEFNLVLYDLAMNTVNTSVVITVTDTAAPEWTSTPENQFVEFGYILNYQVFAIDNDRIDHYWINDTISFTVTSSGVIKSTSPLAIGDYGLSIEAFDPSGYSCFAEITIIVQDTVGPLWVQIPDDQLISENQFFRYDLNATDLSSIGSWSINDTIRFSINSEGIIENITALEPGTYGLLVTVTDTFGNSRIAEFTLTVVASQPPTTTVTTPTTTSPTIPPTTTRTVTPLETTILSLAIVGSFIVIVIVFTFVGRRKGRI